MAVASDNQEECARFGHVERMTEKIYEARVRSKRQRETSVDFQKYSINDAKGRLREKYQDPPKGKYEKVDDSESKYRSGVEAKRGVELSATEHTLPPEFGGN